MEQSKALNVKDQLSPLTVLPAELITEIISYLQNSRDLQNLSNAATLFMSYGQLQRATRLIAGKESLEDLTIAQRALAAGGAGCITSFVLCVLLLFLSSIFFSLFHKYLYLEHLSN